MGRMWPSDNGNRLDLSGTRGQPLSNGKQIRRAFGLAKNITRRDGTLDEITA